MRSYYIILLLLATCSFVTAQKKHYLISPNQEIIPLAKNESARLAIEARQKAELKSKTDTCTNGDYSIYDGNIFPVGTPPMVTITSHHKDVVAEWFVSRFKGTLDTIFWQSGPNVGALDSLVYVTVNKSFITPTAGPGVRPGPYNPPCQDWGYWVNTADQDQGVAAFIDDASDTSWVSTLNITQPGTGVKSFEPFQRNLWGIGAYPVVERGNYSINELALTDSPLPTNLRAGDVFFISFRINGPVTHPVPLDGSTDFMAYGFSSKLPEYRGYYPSRTWQFFEHDSGPSICAGQDPTKIKRGWVARGGFTNDTTDVSAYAIWYSITTTDNTPPTLVSSNKLVNTFDTAPQTVTCEFEDCDPANSAFAGVASASIDVTINGAYAGSVAMTNSGGNTWTGDIPGQPPGTTVSYSIIATDIEGLSSTFPQESYQVCGSSNEYFEETVSDSCAPMDISMTGTEIPVGSFFNSPIALAGSNPYDDGTAGPFALSSPFYLQGHALQYAWIGVDGAISLTETATDTSDVNSGGSYTPAWTFPGDIRSDDRDRHVTLDMPRNFIAPWWQDLIYGDTSHPTNKLGHMYYKENGCQFIVQWGPGIGIFQQNGTPYIDDSIKFRVILDKCNGTVTYQYDNIGSSGLDTLGLVGLQGDSSTGAYLHGTVPWLFSTSDGYPVEYRPKNGRCIMIYQKGTFYILNDKWNMVSVPNIPRDSNYLKTNIFPTATSSAFAFEGGYVAKDTLKNGVGYWIKFSGRQFVGVSGYIISSLNVPVTRGWNLVGSISCPVATSSITDPSISGETFYGFQNGYFWVTAINPGQGYWVKAGTTGSFTMNCATTGSIAKLDYNYSQLNGFSKLVVKDTRGGQQTLYIGDAASLKVPIERYELPPVPPSGNFDARFTSNRAVEVYGTDGKTTGEYTINLQSSAYPIMVQYSGIAQGKSFVISELNEGKAITNTVLQGSGTIRLTNPAVTSLSLKVIDGLVIPTQFALSQNYPNPFNPVTRFTVDVPSSGNVDISVFDLLGRKVATIMNGNQDAGYHTIEWDGKDVQGKYSPSGIYFVRMTAWNFTQVRKIMLLK